MGQEAAHPIPPPHSVGLPRPASLGATGARGETDEGRDRCASSPLGLGRFDGLGLVFQQITALEHGVDECNLALEVEEAPEASCRGDHLPATRLHCGASALPHAYFERFDVQVRLVRGRSEPNRLKRCINRREGSARAVLAGRASERSSETLSCGSRCGQRIKAVQCKRREGN